MLKRHTTGFQFQITNTIVIDIVATDLLQI